MLQAKAIMTVENPYVDYETRYYAMTGQVDMHMKRNFKTIGVTANVDYDITAESWVAAISKPLNEQWTARYSSTQSDKVMAFSDESDQKYEMLFNLPF